MKFSGWTFGVLLWLLGTLSGAELVVKKVCGPFTLDGRLLEPQWGQTTTVSLNALLGSPKQSSAGTTVRSCLTEKAFVFFFECQEPLLGRLKTFVKRPDGDVWTDDSVEVFLSPDYRRRDHYYHLVVNAAGIIRDEFWSGGNSDVSWHSKGKAAVRKGKDFWTCELWLPLTSLNRYPVFSDRWALHFARGRHCVDPPELITWKPCRASFHEPQNFPEVVVEDIHTLQPIRQQSEQIVRSRMGAVQGRLRKLLEAVGRPVSELGQKVKDQVQRQINESLSMTSLHDRWQWTIQMEEKMEEQEKEVRRVQLAEKLRRPYAVFVVSPLEKISSGEVPKGDPKRLAELHCAKGEAESVQILILPLTAEPQELQISVSPLVGPKGTLLWVEPRKIGYVPVKRPTPGGFGRTGRYPDPLLPWGTGQMTIGPDETGGVWLTVWVPRDAPAGRYDGGVEIKPLKGPKTTVKVQVTVYDVTLPVQSSLATCVLIWEGLAQRIYGDAWTEERNRRFYETCLRYRFTPPPPLPWDSIFYRDETGRWQARWEEFDRAVEGWLKKGATAFSIGGGILRWGTQLPPPEVREETAQKLRLLSDHIGAKKWTGRFYFYVFDEPSAAEWDNIRALAAFVKEHAPNLPLILTAGYGATGAYRTHAPTPEGAAYRGLEGSIGIWVPHIDCFDEPFLAQRRKKGDQVWMYVCISTVGKTYPDIWRIDWTGTSHRAIGWWLWKYGCQGFLYWCVNYWADEKGPFDLWSEPVAFPGGNGDGFLFYPDPAKGDPIPTIRAELTRDGIEDYDLLKMLSDLLTKRPSPAFAKDPEIQRLLKGDTIIFGPDRFSDDPSDYAVAHSLLLKTLEKLSKKGR